MAEPHADDLIAPSWDVYDSDGERIGTVDEVTGTYLQVTGELGAGLHVPLTAVEAAAGGEVHLDTSAAEIPAMGWGRPPTESRTEEILEAEGRD